MKKKIIALILCICLISCTCIQPAYAMGAEGIILGGGAAAGVTLTMPQVALLVAAGFGLIYATNHAEDIANGLNNALENAATNISNGIEELTYWKEQATKGAIALASAPAWIKATVKSWVSGLYESKEYAISSVQEYSAGQPVPTADFWGTNTKTFTADVTVLRMGKNQIIDVDGIAYYELASYCCYVANENFNGATNTFTYNGTKYYFKYEFWGTNPICDTPLSEYNQKAFDATSTLPDSDVIKANYTGSYQTGRLMIMAWLDGYLDNRIVSGNGSICPDDVVGGIDDAIGNHGIDSINVPDLDIGGSGLLVPDNVGTGSIDDILNDILTRLKQQEMAWSDFMTDVAVGNPSITIEGKDYVIDDTGVTDIPIEDVVPDNPPADGVVVPEGLEPFTMSLTDFFPFCIPFDIADFVNVLCAEPEAPHFDWTFTWYGGDTDTLTIDLSPFNQVAQLLRNMELLLFTIGLALITRNQIRG